MVPLSLPHRTSNVFPFCDFPVLMFTFPYMTSSCSGIAAVISQLNPQRFIEMLSSPTRDFSTNMMQEMQSFVKKP